MRVPFVLCASLSLLAAARSSAQADDDRLQLMHETVSYTDVIDALDDDDRLDLSVNLSYERRRERGAIYRERARADGARTVEKLADSRRELSQLTLGLDVGLFRDLMASLRLPLVLSDARKLHRVDGVPEEASPGAPAPLFGLPFAAPTRAGIDHVALGLAWAPLNQMRSPWHPTWVVHVEGRRALGVPLRACRQVGEESGCGPEGADEKAGSSRGMSGVLLETRFSRRYLHVEPFAGLSLLIEWPGNARGSFPSSGPRGRRARPGPESAATLGVAAIPWEDRGSFQRLALDVRLTATHVARGTEYSALFDALGTSTHPGLVGARFGGVRGSVPAGGVLEPCRDPLDVDCGEGGPVSFAGVTEVAAHLRYGGQIGLEVQAARYVRFTAGTSVQWVTSHALTGRDPCSGSAGGARLADDGRTCTRGAVDPRHRGVIDAPGRRFVLRDQLLIGVYAQATAMF